MWITPALIAGVSGWNGIWGSGSALTDYLIPIPVAGGVFHVPSFVIATTLIFVIGSAKPSSVRLLSLLAIATSVAAITLQLDFDRINSWLFTDYEPFGSPFRFGKNPFYLFIANDALWLGLYAILQGHSVPVRYWSGLLLVPVIIIVLQAISYGSSGPKFEIGVGFPSPIRGNETRMVYTSSAYDETTFVNWLADKNYLGQPWTDSNTEHIAIIFTNSQQIIKWGQFDQLNAQNTVATFCAYEEDQSIIPHAGQFDCFAGHDTVAQQLDSLIAQQSTGLGNDIDYWFARLRFCENVDTTEVNYSYIQAITTCASLRQNHAKTLQGYVEKYPAGSEQFEFILEQTERYQLDNSTLTAQ